LTPEFELPTAAKHRGATANEARAVMRVRVFTACRYDLPPKREIIGPSVGSIGTQHLVEESAWTLFLVVGGCLGRPVALTIAPNWQEIHGVDRHKPSIGNGKRDDLCRRTTAVNSMLRMPSGSRMVVRTELSSQNSEFAKWR
jgi:hypothetical protein